MLTKQHVFRAAQLDKIVIQHPAWLNAMNGIRECVIKSANYWEPVGCLLLADGGMGKSTVGRAILSQMPLTTKTEMRFEKTIIPAFYAEIPSPATIKSVAASLLARLNDPNPLAGTNAQMTARLVNLIAKCETQLIFMDEVHHLFDFERATTRVNSQVCNWIKTLVNETKVTFCLVGLPKFAPLLSIDSQLARRFPLEFRLGPLYPGTVEMPGPLLAFLAQLKLQTLKRLELRAVPHLDRIDIALQIFAATSGNPSFIMSLAKEAALCAMRTNTNELTLDDFATAWDHGITAKASMCKKNPFRMTQGQLAGSIRSDIYA